MFILSEQKLALLFQEIAKGFVHSPLEISLFIILVLSFFSVFLTVYMIQLQRIRENRLSRGRRAFAMIARRKALSSTELHLLEQLALYLKIPAEKNLLLEDHAVFNSCVRKLKTEKPLPDRLLSSLRCKLGFKIDNPEQVPHSSAELPCYVRVFVSPDGCIRLQGVILHVLPDSVNIKVQKSPNLPDSGVSVTVYFFKSSGVFSFRSRVLRKEGEYISVAHSEQIRRLQRRAYYRTPLRLPVLLKSSGSSGFPVRTTMLDLGGGGARLFNEGGSFHEKDDLTLLFSPPGSERLILPCQVVRLSEEGKALHVSFKKISETSRDRVIRYIFTRCKRCLKSA
jgi:c-di-GMP-binding flagellar brake protein YcgR